MANKFTAGMQNVVQALNEMWAAFAAGPYGALPSTGGTLTGPLVIGTGGAGGNNATLTLSAGSAASTGPATVGYRNGVIAYAMGTESVIKGGTSSDLAIEAPGAIKFFSATDTPVLQIAATKVTLGSDLVPSTDNARALGSAALAYSVVFARTGAINTSDARLKCDLRDLTPAEIAAARDIASAIGIYRWRHAVDEKGQAAREHVGPTVQRVIEIMQAHGLDPFGYGFICHDAWERQVIEHPAVEARAAVPAIEAAPAVLDSLGNLVTAAVPASPDYPAIEARAAYTEVVLEAGDRYAFRYDELAMFIAAGQEARLAALEAAK